MSPSDAILVVDDEDKIRELLSDTLIAKGFSTLTAKNGEDAFKLFEKHQPAALITDLMLPRIDGFMLVEKIRAHASGKTLPIIMMSAVYRDIKVRDKVLTQYGVEYLVKPFSLADLVKVLKKILPERLVGEKEPPKENPKDSPKGKIDHFSVPLILVSYFSEEKTGVVHLQAGNRTLKIYLEKGLPIFAEGRARKDDQAAVTEILRGAMGWSKGEYFFEPLRALPQDIPKYHYGFYGMVYEGARRYYRLDLLLNLFQTYQNHRVEKNEGFVEKVKQVGFIPEEIEIIEKIDGKKTVADLVSLGASRIENVFQILWVLQFMKVIAFK